MENKVVGYSNRTRYWQVYAFNNAPRGYSYKRGLDFPAYHLGIKSQFWNNTKIFSPFQNISLYHTYNSVVATNKPWVVEVESLFPRYGDLDQSSRRYKWGINKIRNRNCKKILFTSQFSFEMNRTRFEDNGIDPSKLQVVYRAIERYTNTSRQEKTFNILFAGNGFYRKGGLELLQAFSQFKHPEARLTIISSMEVDWKVFPSESEVEFANKTILNDPRIQLIANIDHTSVVEEMRRSHVFVATTFDDPFNNTILESLACGVPVITSDIRSIPEYVFHNENGFSTAVSKNNRDEVIDFILSNLENLYSDQELRLNLSRNAVLGCKEKFDINLRNKYLKSIYDNALKQ